MAQKLLKFVTIEARMPEKRGTVARRTDFNEIYREFEDIAAREQASRCSQCGVPFCQVHCPLHNNIPDWLKLTAEGRLDEAYEMAQATNNMPEICGRICPQDRLCEGNCVIERGFSTVTIGSVERYLGDTAWERGWVAPVKVPSPRGQTVAIIGAGPAGLASAEELVRRGYEVHVHDRYDRIGGLLVYGIPNFKLEKDVVQRRVDRLIDAGIQFNCNFEVGRDASLAEIRERYDAVLIATGVYKARPLTVPGAGLKSVHPAMEFLTASNRMGLGDKVPAFEDGTLDARGKRVVVIGAGDTAMDCVRTAVRQGAVSVQCLYRRDRENMPGSRREVEHAEEEEVDFVWLTSPQAILGDDRVSGIRAVKMRLGAPDSSGRQTPEIIEDTVHTVDADMVITALGFDPEDLPVMFDTPELEVTQWGTIRTDFRTLATNLEGVYAAGDIVRGASLVVWAIRDGRDAAASIHAYLEGQTVVPGLAAAE